MRVAMSWLLPPPEEAKGALDAATNLISVLKAALERLLEEI